MTGGERGGGWSCGRGRGGGERGGGEGRGGGGGLFVYLKSGLGFVMTL